MIPKTAIEKAIAGGWEWQKQYDHAGFPVMWERIALDPLFWQALGKALAWKDSEHNPHLGRNKQPQYEWQFHASHFYNLILTGGDAEKFWAEFGL